MLFFFVSSVVAEIESEKVKEYRNQKENKGKESAENQGFITGRETTTLGR